MKGYVSGWETCARSTYSLASSADQAIARNLHRIYYIAIISTVVRITEAPSTLPRRNLEPEVSLWKRIKCFPFTLLAEEFENATITSHSGFVFENNSVRKISWLSWRHRFRKVPFSKCFPSTRKRKVGVVKFLQFEGRGNRAVFSNFSGVVWTVHGPRRRSPIYFNAAQVLEIVNFFGQNAHVWTKVLGGKYSKTFQGLLVT